jgi:hypothetical protein
MRIRNHPNLYFQMQTEIDSTNRADRSNPVIQCRMCHK